MEKLDDDSCVHHPYDDNLQSYNQSKNTTVRVELRFVNCASHREETRRWGLGLLVQTTPWIVMDLAKFRKYELVAADNQCLSTDQRLYGLALDSVGQARGDCKKVFITRLEHLNAMINSSLRSRFTKNVQCFLNQPSPRLLMIKR